MSFEMFVSFVFGRAIGFICLSRRNVNVVFAEAFGRWKCEYMWIYVNMVRLSVTNMHDGHCWNSATAVSSLLFKAFVVRKEAQWQCLLLALPRFAPLCLFIHLP